MCCVGGGVLYTEQMVATLAQSVRSRGCHRAQPTCSRGSQNTVTSALAGAARPAWRAGLHAARRHVLAVPLGFTSDHIETLHEIDHLYRKQALDFGINVSPVARQPQLGHTHARARAQMFRRAPSLNDSDVLTSAQVCVCVCVCVCVVCVCVCVCARVHARARCCSRTVRGPIHVCIRECQRLTRRAHRVGTGGTGGGALGLARAGGDCGLQAALPGVHQRPVPGDREPDRAVCADVIVGLHNNNNNNKQHVHMPPSTRPQRGPPSTRPHQGPLSAPRDVWLLHPRRPT